MVGTRGFRLGLGLVCTAVIAFSVIPAAAQFGRMGGGRHGGGGGGGNGSDGRGQSHAESSMLDAWQLNYADVTWAAVHFEVGATPEQLEALGPAFQQAAGNWQALPDKLRQTRDTHIITTTLMNTQTTIQAKLMEVLSPDQKTKLADYQKKFSANLRGEGGAGPDPAQLDLLVYVDRTWAVLAFRAAATADQMKRLEPAYAQAWADRKAALALSDKKDRAAKVDDINQALFTKLKSVLTDQQISLL